MKILFCLLVWIHVGVVCMSVCVNVSVCACWCVCMLVCIPVSVYMLMCACWCVCMLAFEHVGVWTGWCVQMLVWACWYEDVGLCACWCQDVGVRVLVHVHVGVCACWCTCMLWRPEINLCCCSSVLSTLIFNLFSFYVYERLHACMCTMCVGGLRGPEGSVTCPRTGIRNHHAVMKLEPGFSARAPLCLFFSPLFIFYFYFLSQMLLFLRCHSCLLSETGSLGSMGLAK